MKKKSINYKEILNLPNLEKTYKLEGEISKIKR